MATCPFHLGSARSSTDPGASVAGTSLVLYAITRTRAENAVQYPSGSLNVEGISLADGDLYGASAPRDCSMSVRTGSFDQNTSACARSFSARRRLARPVDFVSSVS